MVAVVALPLFHQISGTIPGDSKSGELRKPPEGHAEAAPSLKALTTDLGADNTREETVHSGFCCKAPF